MSVRLSVPEEMLGRAEAFVRERGIRLEVACGGEAAVQVVPSPGRAESNLATLRPGGWIACPTALGMARRLGIPPLQLGMLLDFFHVKVRACSLGCFK